MATYTLEFPDSQTLGLLATLARRALAAQTPEGAAAVDQLPDEVVLLRWTLDFFWVPALRLALEESKRQEIDQAAAAMRARLAQAQVQPQPVAPTARRARAR